MRNAKGFSLIMIFLLLFQIAHSGLSFMAAAEGGRGVYEDPAKLKVESKSKDENSITWQVVINEAKQTTDELSTTITFNNGQTHGSIEDSADVDIEKTNQGYEITTPTGQETHTITLTTEITNDEQTNFNLSAETEFEDETIIAEETVEVVKEETPEAEEPEEETKTEEEGTEEKSGDEEGQPKVEESVKEEENEENKNEQQVNEDITDEVVGVPHPPFATTARPFAIPGLMSGDTWPNPGSLKLEKEATETGNFAEWEVELTVEGKNLKTSSDIVLVFDRSNSMYTSRLTKAKAAAKQFVDNLLIDEDSTVRIALVPFGTNADPHTDFQGFSGKQHLKDKIDAIKVTGGRDGGTNIQAGLRSAQSLLASSNADQKTIVLLSDGAPTYSFRANNASSYSWPENKYNFILSNFNYNSRIGDGGNYDLPSGFLGFGGDRYRVNGYRVTTNGIATISEARHIINSDTDIYSVGLEVGNDENATYVLENSQNKGYFAGGDDDMTPIFDEIAASIGYAATQAKVKDPLGDMFDLVKDGSYGGENFSASHGTVEWDDSSETFTWDIGSVKEGEEYTLKYKVTLDCDKKPIVGKKYPTNKTTTMTYKDYNGIGTSKDFPIPKVKVDSVKITKVGYRVNVDGEPVDDQGNVVSSQEEAEQFYEKLYAEGLDPDETHFVPAGDTPQDYQLHGNFTTPVKVDEITSVCNVVYFGYVHQSELSAANVIVKHVDEQGNELVQSEILTGNIGQDYNTQKANIDGYKFLKMHEDSDSASGKFTTEEQTVIYVYKQLKGSLKIIKVDADDSSKPLPGAKFELVNEDGVIKTGTTNDQGEIVFDDLTIGTYTLKETKAPESYRLLNNPIEIEITPEDLSKEKTIENSQQDWKIPKTGGIGTLGFYGVGLILMGVALWFVLRRRYI